MGSELHEPIFLKKKTHPLIKYFEYNNIKQLKNYDLISWSCVNLPINSVLI